MSNELNHNIMVMGKRLPQKLSGMVGGAALSNRYTFKYHLEKKKFLNILENNSPSRPNIKRSRCRQLKACVGPTSREAGVGK